MQRQVCPYNGMLLRANLKVIIGSIQFGSMATAAKRTPPPVASKPKLTQRASAVRALQRAMNDLGEAAASPFIAKEIGRGTVEEIKKLLQDSQRAAMARETATQRLEHPNPEGFATAAAVAAAAAERAPTPPPRRAQISEKLAKALHNLLYRPTASASSSVASTAASGAAADPVGAIQAWVADTIDAAGQAIASISASHEGANIFDVSIRGAAHAIGTLASALRRLDEMRALLAANTEDAGYEAALRDIERCAADVARAIKLLLTNLNKELERFVEDTRRAFSAPRQGDREDWLLAVALRLSACTEADENIRHLVEDISGAVAGTTDAPVVLGVCETAMRLANSLTTEISNATYQTVSQLY